MKKFTVLFSMLALCALICFNVNACANSATDAPLFRVTMHGAEVTRDGQILEEMTITLTGTESKTDSDGPLNRFDCNIQFSGTDSPPFEDHILDCVWHPDYVIEFYSIHGIGFSGALNRYTNIEAALSTDFESCIIIVNDSLYVGSTDPDADPAEILAAFTDMFPDN